MTESQDINYKTLARNRGVKKLAYSSIQKTVRLIWKRYFDSYYEGKENVPEDSYLVAMHHCVNFSWMAVLNGINRKCHGWMDMDVVKKDGFPERFFELISVNTDADSKISDLRRTQELSKYWLANTRDVVLAVTDGPSKNLFNEDGSIIELKDRPLYSGIVDVAFKNKALIVPYAAWIPEEHRNNLFASKGVWNDFKYLEKNKKIPYRAKFGEPIDPRDFSSKKDLKFFIRDKQLEMEDYLKTL